MNNNVGNNTKTRKNQNIHFWVSKESKKVLKEDRIPTASGIEEGRVEIAIKQQHSNGPRQNRKGKEQ